MREAHHVKTCRKTTLEVPKCTIQPWSSSRMAKKERKKEKKACFSIELLFFQYMQYLLTINNSRNKKNDSHCVRYFGTEEKTVTQLFQVF